MTYQGDDGLERATPRKRGAARALASMLAALCLVSAAPAADALTVGLLDDFEDGTLGGWAPPAGNTRNVAGGPAGSTRYLEIAPANRLAAFDAGINGVIDPGVTAIEVDMFRPSGLPALEIRLVLFGPGGGNRWTSTAPQILPGDDNWATYRFSILQADLTQVLGAGSYADLTANLNRLMFRNDTGGPSPGGTPVAPSAGVFGIDNVTAIPEPSSFLLVALGLLGIGSFGTRRG